MTCLEVDFPILPINQISQIEGNAGKPIYQMSKWWARRRSSVFRAMLLAGAMKAPEDPAQAAKLVWDVYYANHQKKGALKNLKVADIFMGGGTTIVEGSRLGMQMYGCDLNPIAWLIVKSEMSRVDPVEVRALLDEIEAEVKPQVMPFYACNCPRGHRGQWTRLSTGEVMGDGFDPLALLPEERKSFRYDGPEVIYIFWAKHGPCQVTGCGHRTPIMSSPVVSVKTLTVKAWEDFQCEACGVKFDVEASDARMAPGVPLAVAEGERPHTVLRSDTSVKCPECGYVHQYPQLVGKGSPKKVDLTLLIHPDWMKGSPGSNPNGEPFGGSTTDTPDSTANWLRERAKSLRLLEFRGPLPSTVKCADNGVEFRTGRGTYAQRLDKKTGEMRDDTSKFVCAADGVAQATVEAIEASARTAPVAPFALQGYCPACDEAGQSYSGRFFMPASENRGIEASEREWLGRRNRDLAGYWPTTEIPFGHMTHQRQPLPQHGYTHWWKMFNSRQLLVHSLAMKCLGSALERESSSESAEVILSSYLQMLRYHCMFSFWQAEYDKLIPHFSNNNFAPKTCPVEGFAFGSLGAGTWDTLRNWLSEGLEWKKEPWEIVPSISPALPENLARDLGGKSISTACGDPVDGASVLEVCSATQLGSLGDSSLDLVITDPPFSGLLFYSELSNFFLVWAAIILGQRHRVEFGAHTAPKLLEAVANPAVDPDDPEGHYKRILTSCWKESFRVLKDAGILSFTFHHSEDGPWISVLESLFGAGFFIEATYPIRSDETKGEGQFGSKQVEYDIIHVCRKRTDEPQPISWARLRRQILRDVQQLADLLELHHKAGLLAGDLKVIKRGKALEYFSRHYGKVFVDEGKAFTVRDALIGINQLLDEESGTGKEPPPVNAEPFTRQFLRLFDGTEQQPRDQMQKLLRGTTIDPKEYEERGWCKETQKVYHLTSPLEIAQEWYGKHRRHLTSDYDQAMVLIGASFPNSGINVMDTLINPNFRPHAALGRLLKWHTAHGATQRVRDAAAIAVHLYGVWESQHQDVARQLKLFFDDGEEG
jgi:hypothetical protein